MKTRMIWWMVPALALASAACKQKEPPAAPETPAAEETPTAATPVAPTPAPKTMALSPAERAAKLGFAKYLPQDTEVVMAFHNGSKSAERIQSSKLWKLIQAQTGMGMMGGGGDFDLEGEEMEEDFALPDQEQDADADSDADTLAAADEPMGPAALFGTEFTIALGKSTGSQTANLLTLNSRLGYFQMRTLAKAFAEVVKTGELESMNAGLANSYGPGLIKDLLADPQSGVDLFDKMNMPPLYLAFRTSSSGRDAAAQQLASLTEMLPMLGEMVEPVEVEKAGRKFAGYKLAGAKVSEMIAENRGDLENMLDPAAVDKLIAAVAKKDLVVLSGTLDDYVILFIGSSPDELSFAADINSSLVASNALAFCDSYASKELAAVIYGQKDARDLMSASAGGLSDMAAGLRDGLSGSEGLGDTRDLETLLRMVSDREAALRVLSANEAGGTVAFFEDGLKIESFGGTDTGILDWKSPNKLASLGDSPDVVMFANMTTDAAYDEKARAYLEALMETSYAMAMKFSELPIQDEQIAQFAQAAKMFDTEFRPDLVAMWDSLSGNFGGSLGSERAWIVDLSGSVPAIPGVPQEVVDEGKFPRISMVAPVTDRAKLAASWQRINTSLTGILAKASEMTGEEIPMQKPISSEKDGYTTWFFSLPFFNDDFMPSVTVGDQWFAASSSKNQALDLISKAASGGETRTGLVFTLNFRALEKFSRETTGVLGKNSDALGLPAGAVKDSEDFISALEDLDKLTVHARRDGGVLRTSIHLKTR